MHDTKWFWKGLSIFLLICIGVFLVFWSAGKFEFTSPRSNAVAEAIQELSDYDLFAEVGRPGSWKLDGTNITLVFELAEPPMKHGDRFLAVSREGYGFRGIVIGEKLAEQLKRDFDNKGEGWVAFTCDLASLKNGAPIEPVRAAAVPARYISSLYSNGR
ncbi:MAG: hypothetical protein J5J00_08475 [Deltaproteobacteria bacterium]|nr:hypothetical protein [Deltaproteobacteria bacterium]